MHTYASSQVKRKSFYRKSELQMFCWFGSHICVPKLYTNMASSYKALQWCMTRFSKKLRNCGHSLTDLRLGQIVYISVFKTFRFLGFFHWTVSNLFFLCCVYCMKVKTIYRKPFDALLGSLETLRSWVPLSRALRIPTPWCSCGFTVIGSLF